MLRELVCVVAVFGILSGNSAFAAPEPEEPAPSPTTQPEPEEPPPPVATLMVYTTVLTEQPRSGNAVKAQVWVTATGAPADNVTLALDAGADTTLTPQCTLAATAATTCRLGTLDAQGVTIPLTLQTPRSTTIRTITLTATAAAAPSLPAQLTTTITLAPAAIPTVKPTKTTTTPKPTKTTRSPKPVESTPTPQTTTSPAAPVVPPPVPATVPAAPGPSPYTPASPSPTLTVSSTPVLPQIAPEPADTFPYGNPLLDSPSPLPSSTLLGNQLTPLSATLTAAHGLWLGVLLTAVLSTLFLARRRTRSRKSAKPRSARHRYTPRRLRQSAEQETHNRLAQPPTVVSAHPVSPLAARGSEENEAIATVQDPFDYLKALRAAFDRAGSAEQHETGWHGAPIEVECIGNTDDPRAGSVSSPVVRESRSLSWVWANITRNSRNGPVTPTNPYRQPDSW